MLCKQYNASMMSVCCEDDLYTMSDEYVRSNNEEGKSTIDNLSIEKGHFAETVEPFYSQMLNQIDEVKDERMSGKDYLMSFAEAIANNIFVFWVSQDKDFYTSDFPIVVSPHVEGVRPMYMGLAQYGGELTMPLSPEIVLSVYDRDYFKDKESLDGCFIKADAREVRRQNLMRYYYASRHVFSYKNDFCLIDFSYRLFGKHIFMEPNLSAKIVSGLGRY